MQSIKHDPPKLGYSVREACQVSSLGRTTIFSRIADQTLDVKRVGRRTIISAASLKALVTGGE
jgi:hypothetical protein